MFGKLYQTRNASHFSGLGEPKARLELEAILGLSWGPCDNPFLEAEVKRRCGTHFQCLFLSGSECLFLSTFLGIVLYYLTLSFQLAV